MSEEDILRKMYIDLCEASIKKDKQRLNELLADDYVLVHMTQMKQSKNEYISSVMSGELKYYEARHESIDVTIEGNEAYIIGKTKTLASPFNMKASYWKLKQELLLKKINGRWLIKKSVVSIY